MKILFFILSGISLAVLAYSSVEAKTISCTWPEKPVIVDGRGMEWSLFPVLEVDGFSFRTMNDASHLYLLISATTDDGRTILGGTFQQDLTLWVLGKDKKTKLWGLRIPYSARERSEGHSNPDNSTFSSLGIVPQKVMQEGIEVSTTTWPNSIEIQGDLSSRYGRKPIVELSIPVELISSARKGNNLQLSLVVDPVSPEIKREVTLELDELQHQPSGELGNSSSSENSDMPAGGHRGRHGGGMRAGGGGGGRHKDSLSQVPQIPKPVQLALTIEMVSHPPH